MAAVGVFYMHGLKKTDTLYTSLPLYHGAGTFLGAGTMLTYGVTQVGNWTMLRMNGYNMQTRIQNYKIFLDPIGRPKEIFGFKFLERLYRLRRYCKKWLLLLLHICSTTVANGPLMVFR